MQTVREGLRWPIIEQKPGRLDFESVYPFLEAARERDIQIIWDLLHFGWPDHLDVFKPEFVEAFSGLAYGFARVLREHNEAAPLIVPVNEISFLAWAGGDVEYINPFARGRGAELKAQLVRAFLSGLKAVRSVISEAVSISVEPVIHIVGSPAIPRDVERAEEYRQSMFEAWDMLLGRVHPDLGGFESSIDAIGVNFYDRNEWWNFGQTIRRGDSHYRPFSLIVQEVYKRYNRPMFVSETGTEGEDRPGWFGYMATECSAAMRQGVPIQGMCLYPILNHPGWDDDRHCLNGLWDYASPTGEREIYEPLAQEIGKQEKLGNLKGTQWAIH